MEQPQKINCDVKSCMYNKQNEHLCSLKSINVNYSVNGSAGTPEDESYCGSYRE